MIDIRNFIKDMKRPDDIFPDMDDSADVQALSDAPAEAVLAECRLPNDPDSGGPPCPAMCPVVRRLDQLAHRVDLVHAAAHHHCRQSKRKLARWVTVIMVTQAAMIAAFATAMLIHRG